MFRRLMSHFWFRFGLIFGSVVTLVAAVSIGLWLLNNDWVFLPHTVIVGMGLHIIVLGGALFSSMLGCGFKDFVCDPSLGWIIGTSGHVLSFLVVTGFYFVVGFILGCLVQWVWRWVGLRRS